MKTLQLIIAALILLTPATAISDDAHAARTKAQEETLEALETYTKVLEMSYANWNLGSRR